MSGFGIASEKVPTMKSLDADKKASKVSKVAPAKVSEKVDFSNVKIEPIFEESVVVVCSCFFYCSGFSCFFVRVKTLHCRDFLRRNSEATHIPEQLPTLLFSTR